jgi:DNA-binding NarL/FixJ family response regulator
MPRTRILIADDHELIRKGIRSLLESRSEWEICGEASSGRDAVAKAARLKPDIVLLDVTLPDVSGVDVIPEIIAAQPTIKVLVLTMHDSGQVACSVLAAGASGLVLKSDAGRDLVLGLEAVRRNKPFLSPLVTKILINEQRKAPEATALLDLLTARETEVLKLLAEGRGNKEVGATLGISPRTVDAHRASIMHKLHLRTFSDLIHFAIRNKIVEV